MGATITTAFKDDAKGGAEPPGPQFCGAHSSWEVKKNFKTVWKFESNLAEMPLVVTLTVITYLDDYVTSCMCDGVSVLVWGHFDHSSQARRAVGNDLNEALKALYLGRQQQTLTCILYSKFTWPNSMTEISTEHTHTHTHTIASSFPSANYSEREPVESRF